MVTCLGREGSLLKMPRLNLFKTGVGPSSTPAISRKDLTADDTVLTALTNTIVVKRLPKIYYYMLSTSRDWYIAGVTKIHEL